MKHKQQVTFTQNKVTLQDTISKETSYNNHPSRKKQQRKQ